MREHWWRIQRMQSWEHTEPFLVQILWQLETLTRPTGSCSHYERGANNRLAGDRMFSSIYPLLPNLSQICLKQILIVCFTCTLKTQTQQVQVCHLALGKMEVRFGSWVSARMLLIEKEGTWGLERPLQLLQAGLGGKASQGAFLGRWTLQRDCSFYM